MLPGLRSIIRHRTSICRYSSRRHRSWSKCDEFLPQFTAPFANPQLRCFPLLTQLLLLIEWRSLRSVPQTDFRVNTKSVCRTLRVFITVHRAIRKNAAALLSAACAAPFAHRMALPSWCSTVRFSCKHEICLQNPTSELLYRKMYKKREKFLKKSLAILQGLLYTTKCCDMIAKKHKVAATENT